MMSSDTRRHLHVAIQRYWPVLKEGQYYFDIGEGRLLEMATLSDEEYLETVMSGTSQAFGICKADGEEFNIVVHTNEEGTQNDTLR